MLAMFIKKIHLFVPLKLFGLLIYSHVKTVKGYTDTNVHISTLGNANTKILFFLKNETDFHCMQLKNSAVNLDSQGNGKQAERDLLLQASRSKTPFCSPATGYIWQPVKFPALIFFCLKAQRVHKLLLISSIKSYTLRLSLFVF